MLRRTAAIAALAAASVLPMCVVTAVDAEAKQLTNIAAAATAPVAVRPDMKFTWGWITGTVYFNRAETRTLRTATAAAAAAASICGAFGAQTFGLVCAASTTLQGQWSYVANGAYASRKCVKIKVPTMWASTYSGGYCR